MFLTIRIYFVALVASLTFAAPTSILSQPSLNSTKNADETSSSSQFTSSPWGTAYSLSNASALSLNPTDILSSQMTPSTDPSRTTSTTSLPLTTSSLSLSLTPVSPTPSPASTTVVTRVATIFETTTIDGTPSRTANVTVAVTATSTGTATPASWDNRTLWAAPPYMTDLAAFNITDFPSGQRNLRIVAQVPAEAIAPTPKHPQNASETNLTSSILELVYPPHSVNPGGKPEGGADFYATPLNLGRAHNVTLEYRVFFPVDFDWVKGGKLPGLFGGHTGCSGGASAEDCFSTRMMWRPQGAGELYLYAPKDKQTEALCADVTSVCDAAYGFSIGRGTFNFRAGDWTHLRQNVILNTPGQNNGVFALFVDGRPTINRTDIFYRDVPDDSTVDDPQVATAFIGLFFSTFFGGHGKKYATPREQYTWFKDFTIIRHD